MARRRALLWWVLTTVLAIVFLLLASSDAVYSLTSPPGSFQILLRKSYSVGAFALVGYPLSRAFQLSDRPKSALFVAVAIGAYSLVIEIVQAITGSHEGLLWNSVDVAFGFVGGYLGAVINASVRRYLGSRSSLTRKD